MTTIWLHCGRLLQPVVFYQNIDILQQIVSVMLLFLIKNVFKK